MEELKDRLRGERIRLGLTQQNLADKFQIRKQTVSNWETGQRTPDALTIKALADLFNVTTDYLLCRTDNPSENRTSYYLDEPIAELNALLETAKDFPKELINSITNMLKTWNSSYKMLRIEINGQVIDTLIDSSVKVNGLTYEEQSKIIDTALSENKKNT